MEELCDEQGRFSVAKLDAVVQTFYNVQAPPESRIHAERILTLFTSHPDAWNLVDQILEVSQSEYTKFLAVRVLSQVVSEKWKSLPVHQRTAIRNYIVNIIIAYSSTPECLRVGRSYLTKLNTTLVEIIKKDWPDDWPDFVQEITAASSRNTSLCESIMAILGILSEDVFESSEEELPAWKARKLGKQIKSDFGPVIDLVIQVLATSNEPSLVGTTLDTLRHFIRWLSKDVIYNPQLVEALGMRMVSGPGLAVQCRALKCFRDCLVTNTDDEQQTDTIQTQMFNYVVQSIHQLIPEEQDLQTLYEDASEDVQDILLNYASFLLTYFGRKQEVSSVPADAVNDLLRLSLIQDPDVWSICLDSFTAIVRALRRGSQVSAVYGQTQNESIQLLCRVLPLVIQRMPFSDEVLIVVDGSPKFIRSGSSSSEYSASKRLLKEFALLDIAVIEAALSSILQQQPTDRSLTVIAKVCWAVGAIQEYLTESVQERLIPALFSETTSSQNAGDLLAVSSTMYLASTFTAFVSKHTDILNVTLQSILKYVHFPDYDVQDMAITTLVKICQDCGNILSSVDLNGVNYLQLFLRKMSTLTGDLQPGLVPLAYKAIGFLVARTAQLQAALAMLMQTPNEKLLALATQAQENNNSIFMEALSVIRINTLVCTAVGQGFADQMQRLQASLVRIYQAASANASFGNSLSENVKYAIKELARSYIKTKHPGAIQELTPLLGDILNSPPQEEDVCDLVADALSNADPKAEQLHQPFVETVYHRVFERVYAQICHNFEDFYPKRPGFYAMVRALVNFAFNDLMRLPIDSFLLVVKSILWGMQHPSHEISNSALETCGILMEKIGELEDEDKQNDLYTAFYMNILQVVIRLINDRDRRTQFDLQSELLARLLDLVQQGYIYTRLFLGNEFESNAAYVQEFIRRELCHIYPDLPSDQIDLVTQGMLEYSDDVERFRQDLVDFMADFRSSDEFAKPVFFDD